MLPPLSQPRQVVSVALNVFLVVFALASLAIPEHPAPRTGGGITTSLSR